MTAKYKKKKTKEKNLNRKKIYKQKNVAPYRWMYTEIYTYNKQ